jgi:hypothetical protein
MDIASVSIVWLVVIFFILAALFIVVKSFKLPRSYFKNEKARGTIRVRLLEKAEEEKLTKKDAALGKEE